MSLLSRRIARAEARAKERRAQTIVRSNQNVVRHRMPDPEPSTEMGPWVVDPIRHWMPDPRRMHDPEYRAHWREIERIQPEGRHGDWTYVDTEGWAT